MAAHDEVDCELSELIEVCELNDVELSELELDDHLWIYELLEDELFDLDDWLDKFVTD